MTDTSDQKIDASTPQEVTSVRAKSARHRQVTADKWNQ
jgi:tRNA U54 and U55 pseudouridine synthase Pus10